MQVEFLVVGGILYPNNQQISPFCPLIWGVKDREPISSMVTCEPTDENYVFCRQTCRQTVGPFACPFVQKF